MERAPWESGGGLPWDAPDEAALIFGDEDPWRGDLHPAEPHAWLDPQLDPEAFLTWRDREDLEDG